MSYDSATRPVVIYYDNEDVFDNVPCATPFVTRSNSFINYGKKFGQVSSLTLNGTITGNGNIADAGGVYQNSLNLISGFRKNFKNLKIVDKTDGDTVLFDNIVKINSISFSESTFAAASDFSIDLEAYEDGHFKSGATGVINPEDTIEFNRRSNGSVSLTRTLSAKGFNRSGDVSNALQNARAFVTGRTGLAYISEYSLPNFIGGVGQSGNLVLESQTENIDRFSANYSIVENYVYQNLTGTDSDLYGSLNYPIFKTCSFTYSPSSLNSAKEEASFNIDWKTTNSTGNEAFAFLRHSVTKYVNKLKASNGISNIEDSMIQSAVDSFNLNSGSFFYNLSENEQEKTISLTIDISKDNNFNSEYGVYVTEDFSLNTNEISEITEIDYNLSIKPFGLSLLRNTSSVTYEHVPDANDLMKRSYDYYTGELITSDAPDFLTNKAKTFFSGILHTGSGRLDKIKLLNYSKSDNENDGTISLSASFTNKEVYTGTYINTADYSYNWEIPTKVIKFNKSCLNNDHSLISQYDDCYKRQKFVMSINGIGKLGYHLDPAYHAINSQSNNLNIKIQQEVDDFFENSWTGVSGSNSNIEAQNIDINFDHRFTASKTFTSDRKEGMRSVDDPIIYSNL